MKFLLALTAAMFFGASAALAQGMVTVHVVDAKTGKPLSGVPVALYGRAGEQDGVTDRHGAVFFLTVPDGMARVAASQDRPPYYISTCVASFTVSSDQQRTVTLEAVRVTREMGLYQPRRCDLSNLVQPGVSADVYDIF
jgi:hypothetical protein